MKNLMFFHSGNGGGSSQPPIPPAYDIDAQALFDRMATAGAEPTTAQKAVYNEAIVSMKAEGLWTKTDALECYYSHAQVAALLDWKRNVAATLEKTGATDVAFTAKYGFTTNGTDNWIDTKFTPSGGTNYTLNAAGIIYKCDSDTPTDSVQTSYGAYNISSQSVSLVRHNGANRLICAVNGAAVQSTALANNYKKGYYGMIRKSATHLDVFINDEVRADVANNAGDLPTVTVLIGRNNRANPNEAFSPEKAQIWWAGANISNAEFLTFQTIFNKFITDLP